MSDSKAGNSITEIKFIEIVSACGGNFKIVMRALKFEKCSTSFKFKEGKNFNHMNALSYFED